MVMTPGMRYNLGCFYARVGDRDRALERLEKCVSLAGGFREWIAHDRDWDSLRGDPRFEEPHPAGLTLGCPDTREGRTDEGRGAAGGRLSERRTGPVF
jgi:hypothetical protein